MEDHYDEIDEEIAEKNRQANVPDQLSQEAKENFTLVRKCSALNMDLSGLQAIPDLESLLQEDNDSDAEEFKIDPEFLQRMKQSSLRIS